MADEVIGMDDMAAVFAVTDSLGIHRESVSVELSKEDPGSLERRDTGKVEITLPATESVESFCLRVRTQLEAMGYEPSDTVLGDDLED
jgi:hypothetical protein